MNKIDCKTCDGNADVHYDLLHPWLVVKRQHIRCQRCQLVPSCQEQEGEDGPTGPQQVIKPDQGVESMLFSTCWITWKHQSTLDTTVMLGWLVKFHSMVLIVFCTYSQLDCSQVSLLVVRLQRHAHAGGDCF